MEITGKEEHINNLKNFSDKHIAKFLSGKTYSDENFPVSSFLIKNSVRKYVRAFYFFARTADDIADQENIKAKDKEKILKLFDEILKKEKKSDISVLENLIKIFKKDKIGKEYSRNLLKAFLLDAKKKRYKNWKELLYYCRHSANPVGRFVIDIVYLNEKKKCNNLNEIYKASDSLCTSLQIINHIQDCKDDYKNLDRVYIPNSFFKEFSSSIKILDSKKSNQSFLHLKNKIIYKVEKLLEGSIHGLNLIDVWRLRKETLIILHIAQRLCYLLKNNDPLEKKIKLSRIDLIFCFIKGIIGA